MNINLYSDIIWNIGQHLSFAELKAYSITSQKFRNIIFDTWLDRCHCKQIYGLKHIRNLTGVNDWKSLSQYKSLRSIVFKDRVADSINISIPDMATRLEFGYYFNHPVIIPETVTYLKFGQMFDQLVKIPNSVTKLIFGYRFNKPVIIPDSVISLSFGSEFNKSVNIPKSVTHLTCSKEYFDAAPLPRSITHLNLENRSVNEHKNRPDDFIYRRKSVVLDYEDPLVNIVPNSVTHLICRYSFIGTLKQHVPDSVTHLFIAELFHHPLENDFPNSVIHLYISNELHDIIGPPASYSASQFIENPEPCIYYCLGKQQDTIYDHRWLKELMC